MLEISQVSKTFFPNTVNERRALQGIDRFEAFLKKIGCPTRLSELNIDDTLITRYAQDTLRIIHDENGNLPGRPAMTEADIIEVLKATL